MRSTIKAVLVLALAACGSGARPAAPAPPAASIDAPTLEFLLASAATDFRDHQTPAGFREVHAGYLTTETGGKQYLLCGQMRVAGGAWTPFATINTSGYEQWIGAQATSFCQRASFSASREDLSASLLGHLDSVH